MHGTTETDTAVRRRSKSHRIPNRPPFECIALLLQGGGALGSYQAGAYEALAEANLHPDWIAGISIGAINSAIIAGNHPAERVAKLRGFWEEITANPLLDWAGVLACQNQFLLQPVVREARRK
jgi:NTE family protein